MSNENKKKKNNNIELATIPSSSYSVSEKLDRLVDEISEITMLLPGHDDYEIMHALKKAVALGFTIGREYSSICQVSDITQGARN